MCRLLLICFAFNWVFEFSTSPGTFNFYRSHIIQKRVTSCYVMTIYVSSISSTNKDNAGDLICIPPDLYIESKVVWTSEAAFILCSYEYGLCKFE